MPLPFKKNGVSLGMLRSLEKWPDESMPDWANTAARRMIDMGVSQKNIKTTIEQMEITRRQKLRSQLEFQGIKVPLTEFDEYLADLLDIYKMRPLG